MQGRIQEKSWQGSKNQIPIEHPLVREPASTNLYPFLSKGLKCHLSSRTSAHFKQLGQLMSLWAIWSQFPWNGSGKRALTTTCEKWIFKVIYMKNHVHHLKALKKLYKRHLNGTYRFLIRNSGIYGSKLLKPPVLMKFHRFWQLWATFFTISGEKSICSI